MSETNRVQFVTVRESTFGTTPTTPRMRLARFAGEGLKYTPKFIQPEEIRADRMNVDPVKVNEENGGPVNGEFSWPVDNSPFSDFLRSLLWNSWTNAVYADNDGTADSVITDVATTNTVLTAAFSGTVAVGHLVRCTGFGVAGNNGVFRCTTASATVPRFVGSGITDEAAPAAAARAKVVGFAGVAGDITATATGLGATTLDFTTLGLAVGMWVKIGGTAAGDKFATAALNDWARISAIAATALTLDNRPSGWTTDAGTSKTIKVWTPDFMKNSTGRTSLSIERGWLGQTTPTYILQKGMVVGQGDFDFSTEQEIKWNLSFSGLTGSQSTTAQDASPDAATTQSIMSANVNVGRIAENGAITNFATNYVRSAKISVNNNLRMLTAVGSVGAVDIRAGNFDVTVNAEAYFNDNSLLAKLLAATQTGFNIRSAINSQAFTWDVPRLTFTEGAPVAGGKNQDSTTALTGMASYDSTYTCHLAVSRHEYYEA